MFRPFFKQKRAAAFAIALAMGWCFTSAACVFAQSGTRPSYPKTILAEPKPQDASPYLPSANRDIRLPVTLEGFCVVTLREQQEWQLGSEANQVVFDGQLYWFASQRQRAMFAATPQRYVPALAGNCVVTFAESGVRKRGDPQYGILHNKQLFFFQGEAEQEKFRGHPEQFANLDLANDGYCLVSQTDEQRQLPGLPETTVTVDGLRYQFAGIHQQRKFLANMEHYGVTRPKAFLRKETAPGHVRSNPRGEIPESSFSRGKIKPKKSPVTLSVAEIANKAMGGYCPVSIHEQGTWVLGNPRFRAEFKGLTYLMANEAEQQRFAQNPKTYVPVSSGQCVVSEVDNNRSVPGSIYYAAQYEGRLFLFAGAEQKRAFGVNPENYAPKVLKTPKGVTKTARQKPTE